MSLHPRPNFVEEYIFPFLCVLSWFCILDRIQANKSKQKYFLIGYRLLCVCVYHSFSLTLFLSLARVCSGVHLAVLHSRKIVGKVRFRSQIEQTSQSCTSWLREFCCKVVRLITFCCGHVLIFSTAEHVQKLAYRFVVHSCLYADYSRCADHCVCTPPYQNIYLLLLPLINKLDYLFDMSMRNISSSQCI